MFLKNLSRLANIIIGAVVVFGFTAAGSSSVGAAADHKTLYDIVSTDSVYSKFYALIDAGGFKYELDNLHGYTLFAPSNESIEKNLNGDIYKALLKPENKKSLERILSYHMVNEYLEKDELWHHIGGVPLDTLHGEHTYLYEYDDCLYVNHTGKLTHFNRKATNGIMHRVDRLLIPESMDVSYLVKDYDYNPYYSDHQEIEYHQPVDYYYEEVYEEFWSHSQDDYNDSYNDYHDDYYYEHDNYVDDHYDYHQDDYYYEWEDEYYYEFDSDDYLDYYYEFYDYYDPYYYSIY